MQSSQVAFYAPDGTAGQSVLTCLASVLSMQHSKMLRLREWLKADQAHVECSCRRQGSFAQHVSR